MGIEATLRGLFLYIIFAGRFDRDYSDNIFAGA